MNTQHDSEPAQEPQEDPFDLDVRVYVLSDGEDEEALHTVIPASSTRGCGTTLGCL